MTKNDALKLARDALEMALEALENVAKDYVEGRQYKHNKALTAIEEALAQPPLPVREPDDSDMNQVHAANAQVRYETWIPPKVDTTPPAAQPACWQSEEGCPNRDACCNAQHCLYTTPPAAQPVQETSALTRPCRSCGGTGERFTGIDEAPTSICKPCNGTGQIALAQPAQEPVMLNGLTESETNATASVEGLTKHVQPEQEQWLQTACKRIEDALLSHRLTLSEDADDPGNGYPLVDALCCTHEKLEVGTEEIKQIVEVLYHALSDTTPPLLSQPAQGPVTGLQCANCHLTIEALNDKVMRLMERPWIGLTDEERNTIGRHHAYVDNIIRATEAKLKEKNHD